MNTYEQVNSLKAQLAKDGVPKPDSIRQIALATLGWPYVFGAWGEICNPKNRGARVSDAHPTIKSKCPALSRGVACDPSNCNWAIGVRMYDCRGFTRWLLRQVGLDLAGAGATSQYNTASNWVQRGKIADMPEDKVCCVFKYSTSTGKYEHTGMHIGGKVIVHCSGTVKTGKTTDRGWTHYAIPVGLYGGSDVKPTLRKGSEGEYVVQLQTRLNELGYDCGAVDGKFGNKTLNAVIKFQTLNDLEPDGVVGRKTWAKLDGEPEPHETTYTVKCDGMTWAQVQQIREVCPTASVEKEG